MKAKQKDILKAVRPYAMEVITPGNASKVIKMDEFLFFCIEKYKRSIKAVNVKYIVEYSNKESEVKHDKLFYRL